MMTKLLKEVRPLVEQELKEANKTSPLFNSPHQAYGVIKEEVEETRDEAKTMKELLKYFWLQVRSDDPNDEKKANLMNLKEASIHAACEAIQTDAMAQKAIDSMKNYKE